MAPNFFAIQGNDLTSWGDYGHILQHGMSAHLPRINGRLALERIGPYIPPITFPGIADIVLTSDARNDLEASGLRGFSFRPVEKALIVELHWEDWNLASEEPEFYPDSGEPEDYILGQPHSASAASALGELWELVVPFSVHIIRPEAVVNSLRDLAVDQKTWNGEDIFKGEGYGSVLLNERSRDWFSERWSRYVQFSEFPAK